MRYKINYLIKSLKSYGITYALAEALHFILQPIKSIIGKNKLLINLFYGLPTRFFSSKKLVLPKNALVKNARAFWYSNTPGYFNLGNEKISREDIFIYGCPNPRFTCDTCQKSGWLSRVRQKNLFTPHDCPQAKKCEEICKKHGDDLWTNFHQNFDFSLNCDPDLPAPKCLYLVPKYLYHRFLIPVCDQGKLIGRRRMAAIFQADIMQEPPVNVDWSKYDFLFMFNEGVQPKFKRPDIPVILYGHDFWDTPAGYQWVIDWVRPDVFLTSYPTQWKKHYKFPTNTKILFYPLWPSLFLSRSNLVNKKLDMLVIGSVASPVYKERLALDSQIKSLANKYQIEFSHKTGALSSIWEGPTEYIDPSTKSPVRYLNKWMEYLGSAKYVIFGRMKHDILAWKYYETLGSGAIPIFPEVPDLDRLGVKPFEHYIPLSEIEGKNNRLEHFLKNYEKYKPIAENAVTWYKDSENKLLIDDFEEIIRGLTGHKYQKRLLQ